VLLKQRVQGFAVDAVHPEPRSLTRDDLVEHRPVKAAPVGGQRAPVDLQALGPVHGLAHAQQRLAKIDASALNVEGERPDVLQ
jgi:hypothetical protein